MSGALLVMIVLQHNRLCRNMGLTVYILLIACMQGGIRRMVSTVSQVSGRAVLDISGTIQKFNHTRSATDSHSQPGIQLLGEID